MIGRPHTPSQTADGDVLLDVRGLTIRRRADGSRIVRDLDLAVGHGEAVAIVGESGSGKSMTARALIGLLPSQVEAHGIGRFKGVDLLDPPASRSLRGPGLSLLMQDPFTILDPLARCGQQITEVLRDARGRSLPRVARRAEAVRRLREVGIEDERVADRRPFELSGGMRQRVAIAAALASDPALLIADEPTTALDVTTQREILMLLKRLQAARGMGLVLITHDLRIAFSVCDRTYVLYAGSVLETGPGRALDEEPLHPYTLGLLLSEPDVDRNRGPIVGIPGSVPRPDEVAHECAFASRCAWAAMPCRGLHGVLREVEPGRASRCLRIAEIRQEIGSRRASPATADPTVLPTASSGGAEAVLTVRNLEKVYGRPGELSAVHALRGVDLAVRRGESVALVGESGSGKTTLARCLVGLERSTSGTVTIGSVDAFDYGGLSRDELAAVRRTVQMVFQDPYSSLSPARSIASILGEAMTQGGERGRSRRAVADAVTAALERVGLPPAYARRKPVALSGGERQRVAIARALAVQPSLLICDEPVSALDVSVQAQILSLLSRLRAELDLAYLFITHDLAVVRQIADRVVVLYRGEVVETGEVEQVLSHPRHPYTKRLIASVPRTGDAWLRPMTSPNGAASGDRFRRDNGEVVTVDALRPVGLAEGEGR